MARIAFFSERLPNRDDDISLFSFGLIQSLADHHHDIRVYSTNDDRLWPISHSRIEVVRPFKRWNWWEALKLIPLLAIDAPEIIHFVQPRLESVKGFGPSPLNFFAALANLPTRPKIVLSLYELDKKALEKLRAMLMIANLILVRSQPQKEELVNQFKILERKVQVLPVFALSPNEMNDEALPEALTEFLLTPSRFIFVPGGLDQHENVESLLSIMSVIADQNAEVKFVVEGAWSDLPIVKRRELQARFSQHSAAARTLLTGQLTATQESFLFRQAQAVLLAPLDPFKLKFWRHSRMALRSESAIVVSTAQAFSDELNWTDDFAVIGKDNEAIANACLKLLKDEVANRTLRNKVLELADRQATDDPSNHLSRLYSELLKR